MIAAVLWLIVGAAIAQDTKPNVVFIHADNIGYGVVSQLGTSGPEKVRARPPMMLKFGDNPEVAPSKTPKNTWCFPKMGAY